MSKQIDDHLIEAAKHLRNAAPHKFDEFRAAFDDYAKNVTGNLLQATTNLPQLQGQAQQCAKLLRMLKEIK